MGKGLFWSIGALAACVVAAEPSITTARAVLPRSTSTNTACALASSASSSFLATVTDASLAVIPAELAYDCMRSVPNLQQPALSLLNSLRTYLEFQSSKEYLRNPPQGYLLPAVDIDAEFDGIQQKVEEGGYDSEYEFQLDIVSLLMSAHDGHFSWQGDVYGAFQFERLAGGGGLYAVSSDGFEPPLIYAADDLTQTDPDTGIMGPVTGYIPSPVVEIDGVDVVSFLLAQSVSRNSQDPDALWNQVFTSPYQTSSPSFQVPLFYPGPSTNITFANGTSQTSSNIAAVVVDLTGVNTGDDAYAAFCPGVALLASATASDSVTLSATSTIFSSATATSTQESPSSPTIAGFPYPAIKHSAGSVAGYFLNDTGFTDVAVLQIREFESAVDDSAEYEREFQSVVEKFLAASVNTGKRKLIIDLQGNGGGFVDLGTDTFAQLFPTMAPNSKTNMRDHLGFWILGNAASDNVTAAQNTHDASDDLLSEALNVPLAFQTVVSETFADFPDFQTYYGPNFMYNGTWSSFFQNNWTDPNSSDFAGEGIIITSTNNRTGFTQPYAAQDIVVVTDGYCGSTCTVFSEYLKTLGGVQFIAVGGRPQTGPMQAIGGIKGAQIFPFSLIAQWVDMFFDPSNHYLSVANGTIWENFTYEPLLRESGFTGGGVNGRNHFRMDDETNTPLQFVYEAADCRMWLTREMLYDPIFLWNRVATVAFRERKGTQFNSKYCVTGSTGHPTSLSGGWKSGLGPQTPPDNAMASLEGWQLTGKPLDAAKPAATHVGSGSGSSTTTTKLSDTGGLTSTPGDGTGVVLENNALADTVDDSNVNLDSFKEYCSTYSGDAWLVKLMCGAVQ